MIFQLQQSTLNRALSICSRALSDNNILPVTSMYLFDIENGQLKISSCDMRIIISASIPIIADPIKICIPGKKLQDYIAKSDNELMTFEVIETETGATETLPGTISITLTITTKSGKCSIPCEPGDDFPKIANQKPRNFELPAEDFLEALYKTMFAISDDQLRPSATGLSVVIKGGKIEFAALDFNMVASYSYDGPDVGADFIIPKKALQQIQSLSPTGQLECYISKSAISINFNGIETTSLLIDEKFPDWKGITPINNEISFLTSRTALIASLKRVLPFSDVGKLVKLKCQTTSLLITAENIDYSEEANETIEGVGGEILIGINGEYMLQILGSLTDDKIWFSFSNPRRAMIITEGEKHLPGSKENLVLLMPMVIN